MVRACLVFVELSTVLHRDNTIFFVGPVRNDSSVVACPAYLLVSVFHNWPLQELFCGTLLL